MQHPRVPAATTESTFVPTLADPREVCEASSERSCCSLAQIGLIFGTLALVCRAVRPGVAAARLDALDHR